MVNTAFVVGAQTSTTLQPSGFTLGGELKGRKASSDDRFPHVEKALSEIIDDARWKEAQKDT
jgi:hypothetical protein